MTSVTVRVSTETQDKIRRISRDQHKSVSDIIAEAVQHYEDTLFWDAYDRSAAELRADPDAWDRYKEDMTAFDGTLQDGLKDDPWNNE
jgi:Arc/MetJ-type ribon-helix-helix transcriptional regulator